MTYLPMQKIVEFQGHFQSDSLTRKQVLDVSLNYLLADGKREKFGEGYLIDDAARMNMLEQVKDHFGPTGDLDKIRKALKLNEEQLDELLLNMVDMAISGEEFPENMFAQ